MRSTAFLVTVSSSKSVVACYTLGMYCSTAPHLDGEGEVLIEAVGPEERGEVQQHAVDGVPEGVEGGGMEARSV